MSDDASVEAMAVAREAICRAQAIQVHAIAGPRRRVRHRPHGYTQRAKRRRKDRRVELIHIGEGMSSLWAETGRLISCDAMCSRIWRWQA